MQAILQNMAMTLVDGVMAVIPRPVPQAQALRDCRIISHRGEFDNTSVRENTLEAFQVARHHGVWGIECDIRWTKDQVPVICHDPNTRRVFGQDVNLDEVSFETLRQTIPLVPSLAELVSEFGGSTHLMLEIKAERATLSEAQVDRLAQILAPLVAGVDYHFLALDPDLFQPLSFVAAQHCFPVAETNVGKLSTAALKRNLGGITGHFLLLNGTLKGKHEAAGQRIGTGFIASRNCLFRELNRGVRWIFSNDAVRIQKIRDHYLAEVDGSTF